MLAQRTRGASQLVCSLSLSQLPLNDKSHIQNVFQYLLSSCCECRIRSHVGDEAKCVSQLHLSPGEAAGRAAGHAPPELGCTFGSHASVMLAVR